MKKTLLVAVLALVGQQAIAAEETGVVQALNAVPKSKLVLMGPDQKTTQTICDGELRARIVKLVGMEVKLAGDWQESATKGGERCFAAKAFTVLKTSSGREALTGKLVAKPQGLFLEKDDGAVVALPVDKNATEPYKKMVGSQVIADVRQFKSGPKLVTLILHP